MRVKDDVDVFQVVFFVKSLVGGDSGNEGEGQSERELCVATAQVKVNKVCEGATFWNDSRRIEKTLESNKDRQKELANFTRFTLFVDVFANSFKDTFYGDRRMNDSKSKLNQGVFTEK
jgi:hypothetical protein